MRDNLGALCRNPDGAVAPTVALSLFALIAAGGIAFDYARLASMDTELQNAADQAALAAASQLDGEAGACARAADAAANMLTNSTFLANDGNAAGTTILVQEEAACDGTGQIRFWQDIAKTTAADSDANAKFVEVFVDARKAYFALTPIVGAIDSGDIEASAFAGLGQAICKMPPLMICNPNPGTPFDAAAYRGAGIQVTGHGNNNCSPGTDPGCNAAVGAWGPGDFGFLDVGGNNAGLIEALAFQDLPRDCLQVADQDVTTGNPQGVYRAINTRFDVYDFASGGGTTLGPCFSGSCPAAQNVAKDLIKADTQTSGNKCKLHSQGWHLPANQFVPGNHASGSGGLTVMDANGVDAMGLPRDNCHYASFGKSCSDYSGHSGAAKDRIGNGEWGRGDYFAKYHPGSRPGNASTITRYDTYRWEIANSAIPYSATTGQRGSPVCSTGTLSPETDRRVLSVAVVENCAALSGSSRSVVIGDWVDMFLVEPTIDDRANGALKDSIYMEVIGRTGAGETGSVSPQAVRKAVPYLIE